MQSLLLQHAQQQYELHRNAVAMLSMLFGDPEKIHREKLLAKFYDRVINQQERIGNEQRKEMQQ